MNKCNVVKDLLPLYADDICSEDSRQVVEEHLQECQECRKELEDYRYNTGIGDIDDKKAVADFGKKLKKRNLTKIIVSVIVCLAVIISGAYALLVPEFSVKYEQGMLEANIPVDGGIDVWVKLPNYKRLDFFAQYNENEEIDIYLNAKQTLFTKLFKDSDTSDNLWRTNGFICVSFQDGGTDYIHPDNTVKNIYYIDMDIEQADLILNDPDESNDSIVENTRHLVWSLSEAESSK